MTFSLLKSKPSFVTQIPNEIILTKTKLLGVTLITDLKLDAYIRSIDKQASTSLSLLKLLAKFSYPEAHIFRLYTSCIYQQLEYSCQVRHFGLTLDQSDKLGIIQKRALRIIYGQGKVPYIFLLKEFHLPLPWRDEVLHFVPISEIIGVAVTQAFNVYSQPIITLQSMACTSHVFL